ncbi:MAG: VOC family protein [Intestinibacter sp.]
MKYSHTTIIVSDIEKSIAFYQEVAGLKVQRKFSAGENKILAFLADKEGDTEVELIQDTSEKPYSGSGISLGFQVEDVKAYLEKMKSMGYETTDIISPNPMTHFFYVSDPDGLKIQLIQMG